MESQWFARVRRRRARQTSVAHGPAIPLDVLQQMLKEQRHSRQTCCQMILFVPCVLFFLFLFFAQRDVRGDFYTASAMRRTLTTTPLAPVDPSTVTPQSNTSSVDDADRNPYSHWSYFDCEQERDDAYNVFSQILVPILFPSDADRASLLRYAAKNATPPTGPLRVLLDGNAQFVGPVRIRAKHVKGGTCHGDSRLFSGSSEAEAFFAENCFADWTTSNQLSVWDPPDAPWGFNTDACDEFSSYATNQLGLMHTYPCGGFVAAVSGESDRAAARQLSDTMNSLRFFNSRSVRLVELEFHTYRGVGDVFLHVDLTMEVSPGGGWLTRAAVSPYRLATENGGWLVYATIAAVGVALYLMSFFMKAVVHFKARGTVVATFFLRPWNALELVNMLTFFVWYGVYCAWWNRSKVVVDRFAASVEARDRVDVFPAALTEIQRLYWTACYLNALNVMFLFLGVLRFLRLNARINVLERTLSASTSSFLSVVALLCLLVLAYTIAGVMLFGALLSDFRNTSYAWSSLFRALIGHFDYDAMHSVNAGAAFVYFWTFLLFGLFALLNFCIAILMRHFSEAQSRSRPPPLQISLRLLVEKLGYQLTASSWSALLLDTITLVKADDVFHVVRLLADRTARRKRLRSEWQTTREHVDVVEVAAAVPDESRSAYADCASPLARDDISLQEGALSATARRRRSVSMTSAGSSSPTPRRTSAAGVAVTARIAQYWQRKTNKRREIEEERDLLKASVAELHLQDETISVQYHELSTELSLVRRRAGLLQQQLSQPTTAVTETGSVVREDAASHEELAREIDYLRRLLTVSQAQLEDVWCSCADSFEWTSAARDLRESRERWHLVQGGAVAAVSSALQSFRRRLLCDAPQPLVGAPSFVSQGTTESSIFEQNHSLCVEATSMWSSRQRQSSIAAAELLRDANTVVPKLTNGGSAATVGESLGDIEVRLISLSTMLEGALASRA